jgi:CRISPR-associated protein Csm1
MSHRNYIHALAGLIGDPLLAEHRDQLVPSQWLDETKQAEAAVIRAGKLVAGTTKEASKGKIDLPLQSVFSNIHTDEGSIPSPVFWPQASLSLKGDTVIPKLQIESSQGPWNTFLAEAKELKSAFEGASNDSLPFFVENMQLLLQRHAWCLPSSYADVLPDVSLYDHSRMTAALASALADHDGKAPLAQLVGGDLSGVQKFIYTVSARGATSSLRGRSFYLQLLTEVVARFLLQKLDLPSSSLIYAGGGNFYLLVPHDVELDSWRDYISQVLLHHHSGDLYLAISSIQLQEQDFLRGNISQRWRDLADELNLAKLRSFSELRGNFHSVFEPQGHGGNEELQCQVCGLEHLDTSSDEPRKCPPCWSYEELGKDLRNAHYLVFTKVNEDELPKGEPLAGSWEKVLAHFGWKVNAQEKTPRSSEEKRVIFALSDDVLNGLHPTSMQVVGRRLMVNVTPTITKAEIDKYQNVVEDLPTPNSVKPYDVMEQQANGIKRLGVMRMDVDNLSSIFSSGFGDKTTLSRIGALSFAISLFFEGRVEKLAEDINANDVKNGDGERLYSIYSGGDDLFFVGSWDAVIELARKIRAELSRFAGDNPGIHASAGVVLVGGKYPLYQAAQDAGRAEEQAKDHEWFVEERHHAKDSITFLGQTMSWSQFGLSDIETGIDSVSAWAHRLEQAMETEGSSRSLLRLLMNMQAKYHVAAERRRRQGMDVSQERKVQVLYGAWNWLSAYFLRRMQKRSRDDGFKKLLDEILKLSENQFASIQWIGLAARWAELKLRK